MVIFCHKPKLNGEKMQKFIFTNPQKIVDSLKKGEKLAVFSLDEHGGPNLMVSDIFLQYSQPGYAALGVLEPAIKYIRTHYNKDIKLEQVSALCDISPSYFSRLFSKTLKISFSSYLISLRLNNAKFLLKNTNRSVVSIASECGYPDCGYFNKLFKKHIGKTPLEYRFS